MTKKINYPHVRRDYGAPSMSLGKLFLAVFLNNYGLSKIYDTYLILVFRALTAVSILFIVLYTTS